MRISSNKIKDVVRFFREELQGLYEESEIELFIAYCFQKFINIKRFQINLKENDTISESELLKFNFAVKDLKNHKPIQYVLGEADFYGMKFFVNEQVLIPRPETEELVQLMLNDFKLLTGSDKSKGKAIIDIGTGSGCIAISLKKHLSEATVSALDISSGALSIAQKNAELNAIKINFIEHNILSNKSIFKSDTKFDYIVSNPPYIRALEKKEMNKNVLDFEPALALFVPDENPLLFYKAIADFALNHLNPNGKLYFEINEYLGEESVEMLVNKGFKNVQVFKDINGKNRILRGDM